MYLISSEIIVKFITTIKTKTSWAIYIFGVSIYM